MEFKKPPMPPLGAMPPMGNPGGPPPAGWKPPMADISWVKRKLLDIPYGHDSKNQRLDLYLPESGSGPFPLLIHIHGGGFALGDKRDDHMDAYLTGIKRGYAVASIEYRLSGEAVFPAAVLDCREALRYILAHAVELSIDPERIATIGGSAGGNLSAMMGMNIPNGAFPGEEGKTFDPLPRVRAAIDQFGPMNFKTMDAQARENGVSFADHDLPASPESKYLGTAVPEATDALAAAANPLTYAGEHMCPMLVQHGTADRLVPKEQSMEFVAGLQEKGLGGKVRFGLLEGADHEDKMFTAKENMDLVFDFLNKNMD